ncbi:hypothetical protein HAP94_13905 [Acidithiobacillus ferrivorans]|nr:hypothetical protein [Acidithiobacillus ferrivorans]
MPTPLDALPYPYRLQRHPVFTQFTRNAMAYLPVQNHCVFQAMAAFAQALSGEQQNPYLNHWISAAHAQEPKGNYGSFKAMFLAFWWAQQPDRILVEPTVGLWQALKETDFSRLPVSEFHLPYPAVYLQFPADPEVAIKELTAPFRWYPVDGVFLAEQSFANRAEDPLLQHTLENPDTEGPYRRILYAIYGNPTAIQADVDDDAVLTGTFTIPADSTESLQEIIEKLAHKLAAFAPQLSVFEEHERIKSTVTTLAQAAKILLYMSLPDAVRRIEANFDRSMKQSADRKNPAKRRKAQERALTQYNRIVIGNVMEHVTDLDPEHQKAHRKCHWRRGHFHTVLFGPGKQQRRLSWFRPTLIGGQPGVARPTVFSVKT